MRSSDPKADRHGESSSGSTHKILFALLRWAIGIVLLIYLVRSKIIDLRTLSNLWRAWPTTAIAVNLILLDMALMAFRLSLLFRPRGIHLSLWNSFQLTLMGLFFSTFLPGRAGGDLARVYYALRDKGGRREEILTVLVFDRVIGLFSLLLLPLLFAAVFPNILPDVPDLHILVLIIAALSAGMLAAFFFCVYTTSKQPLTTDKNHRRLWFRNLVGKVLKTIRAYRHNPGTLMGALVISLAANALVIAVTALAVHLLDATQVSARMWVIIPAGQIANSLPLTPGGLGVGETAFNSLFKMAGMRNGADALICWRIWTILASFLGLIFYWRGLKGQVFVSQSNGASGDGSVSSVLKSEKSSISNENERSGA
jgi:uncharacterized protein (TIRG00374 family)